MSTESFRCSTKHVSNTRLQRTKMTFNYTNNGYRVDVSKIVVRKDIAKAADITPRNLWVTRFFLRGQKLRSLRQRLQIT